MARFFPAAGALHAVVVDHGGVSTRAGFAGDDTPSAIFPSVVGKYHHHASHAPHTAVELEAIGLEGEPSLKVHTLGPAAARGEGSVEVASQPRDELIEALSRHALHKLGADASEQPLLLSEPMSLSGRRLTAELMFERFNVPALLVAKTAELAALSLGRTTALVLDVGGCESSAVAVVDGVAAHRTLRSSSVAGGMLARLLEIKLGVELTPACVVHRRSLLPSESLLAYRRQVRLTSSC